MPTFKCSLRLFPGLFLPLLVVRITAPGGFGLVLSTYIAYGVSWSPSSRYATPALDPAESEYIQELKSVAGAFGCSPDEIDFLLSEGFSPEELEEYLYCGEL